MFLPKLKVKKLYEDAKLPVVAHPGEDYGYDVYAYNETHQEVVLMPGEQRLFSTGLAMAMEPVRIYTQIQNGNLELPEIVEYQVGVIAKQPSGVALKRKLDVKAGVIDAGYRNEVKILLYNYGTLAQYIQHGDKIAQLVPVMVVTGEVEEVTELPESGRGLHGWGSGHAAK